MNFFNIFQKKIPDKKIPDKKEPRSVLKGTMLLDSIIVDGEDCNATYKYTDVKIYRHDCDISRVTLYSKLYVRTEPENDYDSSAVALYDNDTKIGYLLKNQIQDMANKWLKREEPIRAMVSKIDGDELFIDLYFYEIPSKHFSSWKNKIITLSGNKSADFQEDIGLVNDDGQKLDFEYDYDKEQYLISDGSLNLGFIPKSFEEKPIACYLEKIVETSNDKNTVKVKIYFK